MGHFSLRWKFIDRFQAFDASERTSSSCGSVVGLSTIAARRVIEFVLVLGIQ